MERKTSTSKLYTAIADLRWLRVKFHIAFEVLLTVHNCIRGNDPNEKISLLLKTDSSRTSKHIVTNMGTHSQDRDCGICLLDVRGVQEPTNFKKVLKTFLMRDGDKYSSSVESVQDKF